jgi:hypothetical protein
VSSEVGRRKVEQRNHEEQHTGLQMELSNERGLEAEKCSEETLIVGIYQTKTTSFWFVKSRQKRRRFWQEIFPPKAPGQTRVRVDPMHSHKVYKDKCF